jgi:SAM-dependent methyltransferase
MKNLKELEKNWEGFARTDPLWAILSDPSRKGGKWTLEDFFDSGVSEISTVMRHLSSFGISPRSEGCALDFGCGVGRLTQALAQYFACSVGVDISSTMIARARELNKSPQGCKFVVNTRSDLNQFEADQFDFIYSSIVLQHINPAYSQEYIREFVRILKPGGYAVFQIPDSLKGHIPTLRERVSNYIVNVRIKLALRSRLQSVLSDRLIRRRKATSSLPSDEFEMDMHCVPESSIQRIVSEGNGTIVNVVYTNSTLENFNGHLRYYNDEPAEGLISKQYCIRKETHPVEAKT